ncbi:MAG: SDR family oxidoreductase, partial [Burkholderiales bacterium]|nr:SDR family oxidoreductase [Burkholderiales bacterium]
ELGPNGTRVHAISPGPVPTRAASGLQEFDALLDKAQKQSPLRRLVSQDEIGNLAAFLVSDASSGMTGQTLYIDAGYHIVN